MERMKSDGGSCSIRKRSLSMSSHRSHQTDNDVDFETVSEAGDIGDRALPSKRFSESNSFHSENGSVVVSIQQELQRLHPNSSIIPLPHEVSSTTLFSTDAIVGDSENSKLVRTLQQTINTTFHVILVSFFNVCLLLIIYVDS
jgi:hypothetical protein